MCCAALCCAALCCAARCAVLHRSVLWCTVGLCCIVDAVRSSWQPASWLSVLHHVLAPRTLALCVNPCRRRSGAAPWPRSSGGWSGRAAAVRKGRPLSLCGIRALRAAQPSWATVRHMQRCVLPAARPHAQATWQGDSESRSPVRLPSHTCAVNFGRTSSSTSVDAGAAADAAAGVGGGGRAGPRQAPIEPGLHAADGSERTLRTWQSVRHVNGVAVYAEEEGVDGEGGALMVSAVVRSSPQECFEVGGSCGACCASDCSRVCDGCGLQPSGARMLRAEGSHSDWLAVELPSCG